ncbi:MAG: RNA polymerase sigma factor [Chitinophagales bacterium]
MSTSNVAQQLPNVEKYLQNFAYYMTQNGTEAKDLYQDTVLKVLTKGHLFKQGTNFKAWCSTIMRNLFINGYRKKKRANVVLDHSNNNHYINSGSKTVNNDGEWKVSYEELVLLVNDLPKNLSVPFLMRYTGYKYDEIAKNLELPMGTVKSRIFLARRQLKKQLKRQTI